MNYRLELSRRALTYLNRLDPATEQRVTEMLVLLAENPYHHGTRQLQNAGGQRSARVGNIRIVYLPIADEGIIEVSVIAPRGQAYRNL